MGHDVRVGFGARMRPVTAGCAAALLLSVGAPVSVWGDVRLLSGPVAVVSMDDAALGAAFDALAARADARHVIVQFDGPVDRFQRDAVGSAGVVLLRYIGDHAFFAALSRSGVDTGAALRAAAIRGVVAVPRVAKVHPRVTAALAAGTPPVWVVGDDAPGPDQLVGLYVVLHGDVALATEGVRVVAAHGGRVLSLLESINGAVIVLPMSRIESLADEDAVQWVEWPLPPLGPVNDSNREITQANNVQAPPYNLDGSGVTAFIYDAGTARDTHQDFSGRLTKIDGTGVITHSTHVAGTVGGDGTASGGLRRGMAPGVTLVSSGFEFDFLPFFFADPGDIEDDYDNAINNFDADISNNSIGTNTCFNGFDCNITGDYGVASSLIDAIIAGSLGESLVVAWANGNERGCNACTNQGGADPQGFHSTAPPACAKNQIAVGALNSNNDSMTDFSSWGPCDDGRLRPDVSAPGCQSNGDGGVTSPSGSSDTAYATLCGTSMASPTVCGLGALLIEDYRVQFPDLPDPRNSTVKMLFAHTAQDLGNPGPDYKFGYGSVRIQRGVDFMRAGSFIEGAVDQGETFEALVPVAVGGGPLRVTLAWDDVPAAPNAAFPLVNDLDLRVFDPSGEQSHVWTLDPAHPGNPAVRTGPDHVNNVEQVFVTNAVQGFWRVEVVGFDVPQGPQTFSLGASPVLVNCSPQGSISLGAPAYACAGTVEIEVVDCDLNQDESVVETVTVTITSESEPAVEEVDLIETTPESSRFVGTIPLSSLDGAGILFVADGDTISTTYVDADDGQGGQDIPVTATAGVDCVGPVITDVAVTDLVAVSATVVFSTDEPATSTVRYGVSCDALDHSVVESDASAAHAVVLSDLEFARDYFFAIDTVDVLGNASTADNDGACFSFTTLNVALDFPLSADPGWAGDGAWSFGVAGGGGSHNGNPTSGHTGLHVLGYNRSGDYTNNLPARYLTTEPLDLTGRAGVHVTFWRWLGVDSAAGADEATVEVSNDGAAWTVVWRATDTGDVVADTSWQFQAFDISAVADDASTVFVRWGMGPTDGFDTYPGWNLDDVQILAAGGPISITFPEGLPTTAAPGEPTEIPVRIVEADEALLSGTAMLHYRYDAGDFTTVPLSPLGGEFFLATLPGADCDASVAFFFSVEGSVSGPVLEPADAPASTLTFDVGEVMVVASADFETPAGWTVGAPDDDAVTGIWERVDPVGTDAQPEDDHTPDPGTICWVTGQQPAGGGLGTNDVDDGKTTLTSRIVNLSDGDAQISYWRWYSNDTGASPNADVFVVDVSNDSGLTWTNVETVGPDGPGTSGGWIFHEFTVSDFVAPTDSVFVRFVASDEGDGSLVEAAIDDFVVSQFTCIPPVPGDFDGDGAVDLADLAQLVDCFSGPGHAPDPTDPVTVAECVSAFDTDADNDVDLLDAGGFMVAFTGANP